MNQSFCELIEIVTSEATDSGVQLTLRDHSQGEITALRGEVRGPHCVRARTLAASFLLTGVVEEKSAATLITDPCYWTPALPFLYDVNLEVEFADGSSQRWRHPLGVKRLEAHGPHLFRERRRIVLRGCCVKEPSVETLSEAVDAEVSLLVAAPSEDFLGRASELGVSLIVDSRFCDSDVGAVVSSYGWYPAVDAVLFGSPPEIDTHRSASPLWGQSAEAIGSGPVADWVQLIVVECGGAERPPAWLSDCSRPVVAVRRMNPHLDLFAARRACDRLQSDLAPEFDLAGYFV